MPTLPSPVRPAVPLNGKELYDSIMSKIEPELLSSELPLLATKYGNEPDDLKRERLHRYGLAFKRYDESYQIYLAHLRQQIKQYKTDAFVWAEDITNSAEANQIQELDAQFSAAAK